MFEYRNGAIANKQVLGIQLIWKIVSYQLSLCIFNLSSHDLNTFIVMSQGSYVRWLQPETLLQHVTE